MVLVVTLITALFFATIGFLMYFAIFGFPEACNEALQPVVRGKKEAAYKGPVDKKLLEKAYKRSCEGGREGGYTLFKVGSEGMEEVHCNDKE